MRSLSKVVFWLSLDCYIPEDTNKLKGICSTATNVIMRSRQRDAKEPHIQVCLQLMVFGAQIASVSEVLPKPQMVCYWTMNCFSTPTPSECVNPRMSIM